MLPESENYEDYEEETDDDITDDLEDTVEPSLTYAMQTDREDGRKIFLGKLDETEALKQAVLKILSTERYAHEIYSWDYGVEIADLIGMPMPYVVAIIPQRIVDAVTADDRVESAEVVVLATTKRSLHVRLTITPAIGNIFTLDTEMEVA